MNTAIDIVQNDAQLARDYLRDKTKIEAALASLKQKSPEAPPTLSSNTYQESGIGKETNTAYG